MKCFLLCPCLFCLFFVHLKPLTMRTTIVTLKKSLKKSEGINQSLTYNTMSKRKKKKKKKTKKTNKGPQSTTVKK